MLDTYVKSAARTGVYAGSELFVGSLRHCLATTMTAPGPAPNAKRQADWQHDIIKPGGVNVTEGAEVALLRPLFDTWVLRPLLTR